MIAQDPFSVPDPRFTRPEMNSVTSNVQLVFRLPVFLLVRSELRDAAFERLCAAGWRNITLMNAVIAASPIACNSSHLNAVRAGIQRGSYPFFILEDDAWPTEWQREVRFSDADGIRIDLSVWGWDTFSSRNCDAQWEPISDPEWVHVRNMLAAASVGIGNERFARAYENAAFEGLLRDVILDVCFLGFYSTFRVLALKRPLIFQGPRESNHNAGFTHVTLPESASTV